MDKRLLQVRDMVCKRLVKEHNKLTYYPHRYGSSTLDVEVEAGAWVRRTFNSEQYWYPSVFFMVQHERRWYYVDPQWHYLLQAGSVSDNLWDHVTKLTPDQDSFYFRRMVIAYMNPMDMLRFYNTPMPYRLHTGSVSSLHAYDEPRLT